MMSNQSETSRWPNSPLRQQAWSRQKCYLLWIEERGKWSVYFNAKLFFETQGLASAHGASTVEKHIGKRVQGEKTGVPDPATDAAYSRANLLNQKQKQKK